MIERRWAADLLLDQRDDRVAAILPRRVSEIQASSKKLPPRPHPVEAHL